ncbi:MAG: hypothetical protein R2824_18045 [Saprospiraceae bacterium]
MATDLAKLQGFQGTLNFDNSKVSLVDVEYGAATAANFRYAPGRRRV